jgi:hypothetical protein
MWTSNFFLSGVEALVFADVIAGNAAHEWQAKSLQQR